MNANDLRKKSTSELGDELTASQKELFNLRMQKATGQPAKPHMFGKVKKHIARIKTIMRELKVG